MQDLTADANNIAGEACLYVYAQEQSGCYAVNAVSGTEASIAAIGPGGSNSMLWDFTAGNPASGNFQQQRVAGVFLDARDGEPMKTVAHGTITPYNSPTNMSSPNAVPYGLEFIGSSDITIESVHTEAANDGIHCEGYTSNGTPNYATCWILSTDAGGDHIPVETNAVHIGSLVGTAVVNVAGGNAAHALTDDTPAIPVNYGATGTYILGQYDANGSRMTLVPQAGQPQVFDGPLFLNNGSTLSPSAGALGFAHGIAVPTGSSSWPTGTAIVEGSSLATTSYGLELPASKGQGVLQMYIDPSSLTSLIGSFSGDTNHSKHSTNTGAVTGPSTLVCGLPRWMQPTRPLSLKLLSKRDLVDMYRHAHSRPDQDFLYR